MSSASYIPLQETNTNGAVTSEDALPQPTPAEMCLIRRSSRFVYFLGALQVLFGLFSLLFLGSIILGVLSFLFPIMGMIGTCKRRPGLLIAHFVYSLILYVFTLISIILMIIYCDHCSFIGYVIGFVLLVLQAVGMRHLRIMIGYARLYPTRKCNWSAKCANKCNTNKACQTQPNQVAIQIEAEKQPEPVAIPQPMAPQFYPAPQVVAVPHPYMAMQSMQPMHMQQMNMQQMKYPMVPQGIPMMPMGMQPYIPSYPMQQDPQQQLYPNVHPVYRQN